MKFLCLIAAEKVMEQMPPADAERHFHEYAEFTESIKASGHFIGANRLKPALTATTVRVRNGKVSTTDGPFAETKELVAGFWLLQVKSMDEAVAWMKKCPHPFPGQDAEIEIRQVYEAEDFGPELTPELREQEDRLRAEIERQRR